MKKFHFKFKYIDWVLIILVLALSAIGVVVIGSAVPGADYQKRQLMGVAIGLMLLTVIMLIDYNWMLKLHWPIYVLCIAILAAVLIMGDNHKGAVRWINFHGISFQPSEFAKVLMIMFWAWLFGKNPDVVRKWRGFFVALILTAIPLLLIVKEPDLSTTILFSVLFVIQLYISGFSYKKFAIIIGALVPIIAAVVIYIIAVPPTVENNRNKLLEGYQYQRIMAFVDPDKYDAQRWQQDNAVMAIGSGQLTGKGLYNNSPNSVKNGNYIAEPQTDFIMAVVGEELGFAGCIVILILLLLIAMKCVVIGARAPDMSGRLICFGVASILVFQTFINIGVVTEILPNTGIPLPFVSSGLSSLLSMYAGIGLVLNVRFRKKASLEEDKNEHRFNRT